MRPVLEGLVSALVFVAAIVIAGVGTLALLDLVAGCNLLPIDL